mgnify:CR=1 FL=1
MNAETSVAQGYKITSTVIMERMDENGIIVNGTVGKMVFYFKGKFYTRQELEQEGYKTTDAPVAGKYAIHIWQKD